MDFLQDITFLFPLCETFFSLFVAYEMKRSNVEFGHMPHRKFFHVYKLHFCTLINLIDTCFSHGNLISAVKKHTLKYKNVRFKQFHFRLKCILDVQIIAHKALRNTSNHIILLKRFHVLLLYCQKEV